MFACISGRRITFIWGDITTSSDYVFDECSLMKLRETICKIIYINSISM